MLTALRYAFTTLLGPWLILPVVVFELSMGFLRGGEWRGDALWTVDWFAIGLFYLLPIVAGVAAIDGARLTSDGRLHLIWTTRKGRWILLRAALWTGIPIVVIHTLTVITGFIVGGVFSPSIGWEPVLAALMVHCLAILWAACLGSMCGRLLSITLSAILAVTMQFAVVLIVGETAGQSAFHPFLFGAASLPRIGWTVNYMYLGLQGILFGATAVLMLAIPARTVVRRNGTILRGCVLGLVVILAFWCAGTWGPKARLRSFAASPSICLDMAGFFSACFFPEHHRLALDHALALERIFAKARLKGYTSIVPNRVIEATANSTPGGPGIQAYWMTNTMLKGGVPSFEEVIRVLTIGPFHCSAGEASMGTPAPPEKQYWRDLESLRMTWRAIAEVYDTPVPFDSPSKVLTPVEAKEIVDKMANCSYFR